MNEAFVKRTKERIKEGREEIASAVFHYILAFLDENGLKSNNDYTNESLHSAIEDYLR